MCLQVIVGGIVQFGLYVSYLVLMFPPISGDVPEWGSDVLDQPAITQMSAPVILPMVTKPEATHILLQYRQVLSSGSRGPWQQLTVPVGGSGRVLLSGLMQDSQYEMRVQFLQGSQGISAYSSVQGFITLSNSESRHDLP